jgi:AraC-like DNA-binding protein
MTFEKKDDYQLVERMMNWLEDNYADPNLTIDDLVAQSSLGRAAYVSQIETLTKKSPKEFITEFRIKKAILLFDSHIGISVPDVVKSTGFNDPIYFAHSFKSMTGMSPTEYRRMKMTVNTPNT